jgi:hypothetical protein
MKWMSGGAKWQCDRTLLEGLCALVGSPDAAVVDAVADLLEALAAPDRAAGKHGGGTVILRESDSNHGKVSA